jgi:hypothetical protein
MTVAPNIYIHESDDPDLARLGWAAATNERSTVIWLSSGLTDEAKVEAVQAAMNDLWPPHRIAV